VFSLTQYSSTYRTVNIYFHKFSTRDLLLGRTAKILPNVINEIYIFEYYFTVYLHSLDGSTTVCLPVSVTSHAVAIQFSLDYDEACKLHRSLQLEK